MNVPEDSLSDTCKAIIQAINSGAGTAKEIGEVLYLSVSYVSNCFSRNGRSLKAEINNYRRRRVRELVDTGYTTADIAKEFNITLQTVYRHKDSWNLPMEQIERNRSKREKRKARGTIDRLSCSEQIRARCAISEIAEKQNVTKQAVSHYIKRIGQHLELRQAREIAKQNKRIEKKVKAGMHHVMSGVHKALANMLAEAVRQKVAPEDEWAYTKAAEYVDNRKKTNHLSYPFFKLFKIFKQYDDARKNGRTLTLEYIGEHEGLPVTGISKIFRKSGVKSSRPLSKTREIVPEEKKRAIERGSRLLLPTQDIAYFLSLPYWVVSYTRNKTLGGVRSFGRKRKISWRCASQIYESADAGFTKEETMELLDINGRIFDYAIEHRQELGDVLIDSINTLYPERDSKTPYVEKKN